MKKVGNGDKVVVDHNKLSIKTVLKLAVLKLSDRSTKNTKFCCKRSKRCFAEKKKQAKLF